MVVQLCPDSNGLDLSDACVRTSLSAIIPAAFVFVLCLFSVIPVPAFARQFTNAIKSPFRAFLPLREAEALVVQAEKPDDIVVDNAVPLWRTVLLSFVALVQALVWTAVGAYSLITGNHHLWTAIAPLLIAATWIYASCKPVFWPKPTIHYDLFTLFVLHLVLAIVMLGGTLYEHEIFGVPLPSKLPFFGLVANLLAVLLVLAVVGNMPFELPSNYVKKEDIASPSVFIHPLIISLPLQYVKYSPEEYVTMWEWITFAWVYPLITRGSNMTMNEDDVWALSLNQQSRPVFIRFSNILCVHSMQ
jgi:hypothetical protein